MPTCVLALYLLPSIPALESCGLDVRFCEMRGAEVD